MLTVVIDTNILLQCPPLSSLDWGSLGSSGVRIVIPLECLGEIDEAKMSGNTRRAKKAREVATMFNDAMEEGGECHLLPGTGSCYWEFGPGTVVSHSSLNPIHPDHRVIGEALDVLAKCSGECIFLTADTLARVLARRVGLTVKSVPETWLLRPEPDPRDKRLREVESKLAALEKTAPRFDISALFEGNRVERLAVAVPFARALSASDVDRMMSMIQQRHPVAQRMVPPDETLRLSARALGMRYVVPTGGDFSRYREKQYPAWLAKVRQHLTTLPDRLYRAKRVVQMTVELHNSGAAPADGILFEYQVFGGLTLLPHDEDMRTLLLQIPDLPRPPSPPEPRQESLLWPDGHSAHILDHMDFAENRANRDRHTFYWREKPADLTDTHAFECEEFRHSKVEAFVIDILLPSTSECRGSLVCRLSARNMQPVQFAVPISQTGKEIDALSEVEELISPPRVTFSTRQPGDVANGPS